ncbi:MAG: PIN domain-containing protein [Solirubrobacterales bacterium]
MIVLDTTILVYAVGSDHSLREPCRQLIAATAERKLEATTSVEAIQEFIHVRARRRGRADAAALGRDYAELLSPLLVLRHRHLEQGLALFERLDGLGAFDSVLAAAALDAGARLVSADAAFAAVEGLDHVSPADFFADEG